MRRWFATIGVAVLVAAGCTAAGLWQWSRHVDRSAAIDLVLANYGAEPVPADALLTGAGRPLDPDDVWRAVELSGRYLPGSALLRNRPVDGRPGFHILVPFRIDEGRLAGDVLVVDRGWVPMGDDGSGPSLVPAPPSSRTDLVVRLRADEPPSGRDGPEGQVHSISTEQVRAAAGVASWDAGRTLGAYGALASENGSKPAGVGSLPRPSTDLGSHLSYAFQWWVFALGSLVGCAVLIVRENRENRAAALGGAAVGPGAEPSRSQMPSADRTGSRRIPPSRRRGRSAEEEEDALLDAQEALASGPRPDARPRHGP